jgi:hypothetical protein
MSTPIRYDSLDLALGRSEDRYFGSGYIRVTQSLARIAATPGSVAPAVSAVGRVLYPADWSRKGAGRMVAPHLSSLDMLLLACTVAEVSLAHSRGLSPAQLRRSWVSRIDLRTGNEPQVGVGEIPVTATETGSRLDRESSVTTFAVQVGGAKVSLDVVHDSGELRSGPASEFESAEELLGPDRERLYGAAYKDSLIETADIELQAEDGVVRAQHQVRMAAPSVGAEAAFGPSLSYPDVLIAAAQLSQILVYQMDDISRADSNTFWLRRMTLSAESPDRICQQIASEVRVVKHRVLDRPEHIWSTSDVAIQFGAVHVDASVAHELPQGWSRR